MAMTAETKTTLRFMSPAKAGITLASSHSTGAASTSSGRTGRLSNIRAPAQVSPLPSNTSEFAAPTEIQAGAEPCVVSSASPSALTI